MRPGERCTYRNVWHAKHAFFASDDKDWGAGRFDNDTAGRCPYVEPPLAIRGATVRSRNPSSET